MLGLSAKVEEGCENDPAGCQAQKETLLDKLILIQEQIKEKEGDKDDECPFAEALSDIDSEIDYQTEIMLDIEKKLS